MFFADKLRAIFIATKARLVKITKCMILCKILADADEM
jgi:hypothetical protein